MNYVAPPSSAIDKSLGQILTADAARIDRDGVFPAVNIQRLRRAGLPALTVPQRYGGLWGGLREATRALDFLNAHSTKPAFQVRFTWQPHSIAFRDNRSFQDIAMWDYFPRVRSGDRVTIKADRPFRCQMWCSLAGSVTWPTITRRGRPTYPRVLARRVADLVGLGGSQNLPDLRTGPSSVVQTA